MCTTCGCGHEHTHTHIDENGNVVTHAHADHARPHERTTTVTVEEDILARNNADAALVRTYFRKNRILALNLVSSPGSGKTELLAATLKHPTLKDTAMSVIEGDLQTDNDAARIRSAGGRAVQINTGRGCHLEAREVLLALSTLKPAPQSVVFIENVGNLVCPAEFDLGEAHKVALISVTEGDDKPLKYPDMFAAADLVLINKTDLAPYVKFDLERCEENVRRINPKAAVLRLSAVTGDGMDAWCEWLKAQLTVAML